MLRPARPSARDGSVKHVKGEHVKFGEVAGSQAPQGQYGHWRDVPTGDVQFWIWCDSHAGAFRRVGVVTKNGLLVTAVGAVSWVRPGSDAMPASCEGCVGAMAFRSLSVAAVRSARRSGITRVLLRDVLA